MLEEEARKCSFVLVGNVPSVLRSADLRAFFSHVAEKRGFVCFHFRHRPEQLRQTEGISSEGAVGKTAMDHEGDPGRAQNVNSESSDATTCAREGEGDGARESGRSAAAGTRCCVAAVSKRFETEFLRRYSGRHWAKSGGELLRRKVKLSKLSVFYQEKETTSDRDAGKGNLTTVNFFTVVASNALLTGAATQSGVPWSDLCTLPELNPPSVMPNGNVGTPTSVFMDLIHQCKLPGRIIKKLNLEFPKTRSKRRYGAVGLDYGEDVMEGGGGEEEEDEEEEEEKEEDGREGETRDGSGCEAEENDIIPSDDDHDAEEWERYEALHDDVDKQGRTKERLFEEEMEVVWEKGGSGLVFYTDASYWHDAEGDFDEQCSKEDDWDVDTTLYYDPEGGDKGARDLRDIRHEMSIRDGAQQASVFAGFEKYTKGIGSKVLRRSGWREGSGVGRSSEGRPEPVDTDGQHPQNKAGLGYRGEKLIRHAPQTQKRPRRATRDVIISTVYDRRDEEESTVLRSAPPRTIKYRQPGIKFVAGNTLKPSRHK